MAVKQKVQQQHNVFVYEYKTKTKKTIGRYLLRGLNETGHRHRVIEFDKILIISY